MRYTHAAFSLMMGKAAKASGQLDRIAGKDERPDFHQLTRAQVDTVLDLANAHGYRKPKNANGSRARYFYAWLLRLEGRAFKSYDVWM